MCWAHEWLGFKWMTWSSSIYVLDLTEWTFLIGASHVWLRLRTRSHQFSDLIGLLVLVYFVTFPVEYVFHARFHLESIISTSELDRRLSSCSGDWTIFLTDNTEKWFEYSEIRSPSFSSSWPYHHRSDPVVWVYSLWSTAICAAQHASLAWVSLVGSYLDGRLPAPLRQCLTCYGYSTYNSDPQHSVSPYGIQWLLQAGP